MHLAGSAVRYSRRDIRRPKLPSLICSREGNCRGIMLNQIPFSVYIYVYIVVLNQNRFFQQYFSVDLDEKRLRMSLWSVSSAVIQFFLFS